MQARYYSKMIWDRADSQLENYPAQLAPTLRGNEVITATKQQTYHYRSTLVVKSVAKLFEILEPESLVFFAGYRGCREEVYQLCAGAYGRHIARSRVDLMAAQAELFNHPAGDIIAESAHFARSAFVRAEFEDRGCLHL